MKKFKVQGKIGKNNIYAHIKFKFVGNVFVLNDPNTLFK